MKGLFRAALFFAGAAVVLVPLHLMRFGQPGPDPFLPWLISDAPLYHAQSINGHFWAIPNTLAAAADQVNPRRFPIAKPPGTYRIFCIGQSTTEGFPFQPRGGYPEWLEALLKGVLPSRKIEVINAGICGSDSTRDLAIVKEVLKYRPDLLVLYEGNNEADQGRTRLFQARFGNGVGRLVFWLRSYFPIMRWVGARVAEAPFRVTLETLPLFERNVDEMLALARARRVPVVLLGQVNWNAFNYPPDPHNQFLEFRQSRDVLYIDAQPTFQGDRSCRGTPADCLLDSEHPSLHGQWLIASALAHGLAEHGWSAPTAQWRWSNVRSEAAYRAELGLANDFLATAFVREAWGASGDPHGRGNVPYDIAESDHFEKGGIPGIVRKMYQWIGPPPTFVKSAIISYYDKGDPSEVKKFEAVLRMEGK